MGRNRLRGHAVRYGLEGRGARSRIPGLGGVALAAAMCACLMLPSISAALGAGSINGVVTRAAGGTPIEGTEVCAYAAGQKTGRCERTNARGEYTLTKLPEGEYLLEFVGNLCRIAGGSLDCAKPYATQYWLKAATPEQARAVPVLEGLPSSGFDGSLTFGGEIEGSITDSEGDRITAPMCLYAISTTGELVDGFDETETGHYLIEGLESGSYDIYIEESIEECTPKTGKPTTWASQYYGGALELGSATAVALTAGVEPPAPATADFRLIRSSAVRPANTGAPQITGVGEVGQTLTCSPGVWVGTPAPTYSYQWLRGFSPIASATSSTYVVQPADSDSELQCMVTATNEAGSESDTSARTSILMDWKLYLSTPPTSTPTAPATPGTAMAAGSAAVRAGVVGLSLTCSGQGACAGTFRLRVEDAVRKGKHHKRKLVTVRIGQASFSIALGGKETVNVHLTGKGKVLLAKAGKHGLRVTLEGTDVKSRKVLLKPGGRGHSTPAKHNGKH
jgi:Carboxypeptidase regulatory-like domain